MNKDTRKLSNVDDEIMADITPFLSNCDPIVKEDNSILRKLDVNSKDCMGSHLVVSFFNNVFIF